VVLLSAVLAAGCGSSKSSPATSSSAAVAASGQAAGHTRFAKTKFVLHAGLAFGAFHRYIYKPFKAGDFGGSSLTKHKTAVLKAALAGLFAYHELKLALNDAKSSRLLSKLLTPITALQGAVAALGAKLKGGGQLEPQALESANTQIAGIGSSAAAAGQNVTERVPSVLALAKGG
jgi:hypothetical protein